MTSRLERRAAIGFLVAAATLGAGLAQAVGVPGQGTWETTLQPRELDGNVLNGPEAFYDTALDITWLRNADLNGPMSWNTAKTWANNLVVGSVGGWRLPKVVDTGAPGCDFGISGTDCGYNVDTATGEMAHLYYVTLGNKAYFDTSGGSQSGWGLTNTGGFQNLQSYLYWSGTAYLSSGTAWIFSTDAGYQTVVVGPNPALYAMAVHPGDVPVVPEPQTYAMLLLGLSAVMVAVRRRPR